MWIHSAQDCIEAGRYSCQTVHFRPACATQRNKEIRTSHCSDISVNTVFIQLVKYNLFVTSVYHFLGKICLHVSNIICDLGLFLHLPCGSAYTFMRWGSPSLTQHLCDYCTCHDKLVGFDYDNINYSDLCGYKPHIFFPVELISSRLGSFPEQLSRIAVLQGFTQQSKLLRSFGLCEKQGFQHIHTSAKRQLKNWVSDSVQPFPVSHSPFKHVSQKSTVCLPLSSQCKEWPLPLWDKRTDQLSLVRKTGHPGHPSSVKCYLTFI